MILQLKEEVLDFANEVETMICVFDVTGAGAFFNRAWLSFRGRTLEQELRQGWMEGVHPEEKPKWTEALSSQFCALKQPLIQHRLRRSDGQFRTILTMCSPYMDGSSVMGYVGWSIDVAANSHSPVLARAIHPAASSPPDDSSRQEILKALTVTRARNRALVENTSEAIFLLNGDYGVVEASARACDMLGYSIDELKRMSAEDLFEADEFALFAAPVLEGKTARLEMKCRRKDNSVFPVESSLHQVLPGTIQLIARDISERKRAENAVSESEFRYRMLVETATEGIWLADANDRTVFVNTRLAKMLDCSIQDCMSLPWEAFVYPDDLERVRSRIAQRNNGVGEPFDLRIRRKNGAPFWVQVSPCAICGENGERVGQLAMITDINDRKSAEEQLRQTAERLEAIVNNAPLGIVITDADGRILETNPAFQTMLGYSSAALRATSVLALAHPEDVPAASDLFVRLLKQVNHRREIEQRYIRQDRSVIWVHVIVTALDSGPLGQTRTIGLVEDITERKAALDDLQQSEARFRALLNSDLVGISVGHDNGAIQFANDEFLRIVGRTRDELSAGLDWKELTNRTSRILNERSMYDLKEKGTFGPFEKQYVRKDGSNVTVLIGGVRYKEDEAVVMTVDLTQLKAVQREVDRLAQIVESTADAVVSVALNGTVLTWNRGAQRLYGYLAEEIVGRCETILFPNGRDELIERAEEELRHKYSVDPVDTIRLTKSKEVKPVSVTVSPLRDDAGIIIGWSRIARDLTHEKRAQQLEEQFRQAQRLESVGRLAGGVAHDFNNLLMIISSHTEMLHSKLEGNEKLQRKTREILRATEKAADLTQQLLAFSRQQVMVAQVLNLNEVVTDMAGMAKRLIGKDIDIAFNAGVNLWPIQADPGQVSQVLLNLIINARDAMPSGGFITIETRNVVLDAENLPQIPGFTTGRYVLVTVQDTGMGMSEATQKRIFEPFFTTKQSKGTGLGLATVYGIVKQSGGFISVDSSPGNGTCFRIYFPESKESVDGTKQQEKPDSRPGSGTILLVEDEASLRTSVSEYLREIGYEVLEAENGKEALKLADSHQGTIHLLLTDVVMPEMSGIELAKRMMGKRAVRVLYMSGYSDEGIVSRDVLNPDTAFIRKPFPLGALASKLSELV